MNIIAILLVGLVTAVFWGTVGYTLGRWQATLTYECNSADGLLICEPEELR